MNPILLGNIISAIGCVLLIVCGLLKKKKQILLTQCGLYAAYGAANIVLSGATGAITNFFSLFRNLVYSIWKPKKWMNYVFAAAFLVISYLVSLGYETACPALISWFPALSGVLYSLILDEEDEIKLKFWIIIAQAFWLVYDFAIKNYVSFIFDISSMVANVIGIIRIKRERSKENAQ